MSSTKSRIVASGSCAFLLASALAAPAALASSNDDDSSNERVGVCTAGSYSQLEVEREHSGTKVELKVRQAGVNERWSYEFQVGDQDPISGEATTSDRGRLEVERWLSGTYTGKVVSVTAQNATSGESCSASLTVTTGSSDDDSNDRSDDDDSYDDDDKSSHVDDDSHKVRECTNAAEIKVKVRSRKAHVKMKMVVDSDDSGERWAYRVKRADRTLAKGKATTQGAKAKFAVKERLAKRGGKTYKVSARNLTEDDRCRVRVRR